MGNIRRGLKSGMVIGATSCFASMALAGVQFNTAADVKAITDVETALATQTDMNKLIGYYAPDAYVQDIIAPGLYHGRKQIHESFAKQFEAVKSMKGAIQDLNIVSDGKMACAAVRVSFDSEMKDGSKLAMSVRQLDVYKKIGTKWQIIMQQTSVPMDPATGMAVMNAQLPVRGPMKWSGNLFPSPAVDAVKAKEDLRHWVVNSSPIVDVDEMIKVLGPDKDALLFDLTTPGEYRGTAEIRAAYAPSMNQLKSAKIQLGDFVSESDGIFGAQQDTQSLRIVGKDDSVKVISFRETDCFHRINGKWVSFFESLSWPVDPKTGKSVITDPNAKFD